MHLRVNVALAAGGSGALCMAMFNPLDVLRVRWQIHLSSSNPQVHFSVQFVNIYSMLGNRCPTATYTFTWTFSQGQPPGVSLFGFTRRVVANDGLWRGLWAPGIQPNICFQVVRGLGFGRGQLQDGNRKCLLSGISSTVNSNALSSTKCMQ